MEEHSLAEAEIQVQILAGANCTLKGGGGNEIYIFFELH